MKGETVLGRAVLLAACLCAGAVRADDRAGDFTHYVLALSWNASWCALEGEARGAAQCDPRHEIGFTLHGLWPQREDGWPAFCPTPERDPSRAETAAMADIMGSARLAWYQWKKHGRCSGLPATEYFALARQAFETVRQPEALVQPDRAVRVDPATVEAAFLEANPALRADQLAVTCRDGLLHEVRVCLTGDLAPRTCTPQVERGCRDSTVQVPPVR